ncbi:MAG: aminotransferase class V-fold PLP-dependent enzyme, partial [Deltaproteobacteria bacterium]|nr:aminotransferase class V-fold PLP-dependent enzyme [Deltaproteobacteria bacterium]
MVRRCTILAHRLALAGGSVLSPRSLNALRKTLSTLAELGIEEACVVDGEQAEALAAELRADRLSLRVEVVANRSWRHASGSALIVAREFIEASSEPCLIVRADREPDRETLARLRESQLGPYEALLAVAPVHSEGQVSCSDYRVRLRQVGRPTSASEISQLGPDLDNYDALSIGHAVIRPELLAELEALPNPTLEDGLAQLISAGAWVRSQFVSWTEKGDPEDSVDVESGVEALLDAKAHPRYTLLNPGPVNTTARVKSALVHHDVCHRDGNFSELMVSLSSKLRRIFRGGPRHSVCMVTGSGTAAMECAIASAVPRHGKILVIDNGAFGERMLEVASLHEMDTVHLRYPWGDEVNVRDVEAAFDAHPDIAVVAMVHHETSVGL